MRGGDGGCWLIIVFGFQANKTALLIHELWNKYAGAQHVQLQVDNVRNNCSPNDNSKN